jgi:hypothetical protein
MLHYPHYAESSRRADSPALTLKSKKMKIIQEVKALTV